MIKTLQILRFELISLLYLAFIFLFPFYITYTFQLAYPTLIYVCPAIYFFGFLSILCCLGSLHRHNIRPGKMMRSLTCQQYIDRRFYGLFWSCLYYFTPIYFLVLSIPILKHIVFRAFGYKGSLDITLYADTWIRDLPLLDIGKGVYIANKATIGTNMPLINGKILVSKIKIGSGSLIGHLSKIGPGAIIGTNTEIATDCAIGISAQIGNNVRIGSCVLVDHYAVIGSNVKIGSRAYIGTQCKIGDNIKIPSGTIIPPHKKLLTQSDLNNYIQHSNYEAYNNARQDRLTSITQETALRIS